MNAYCNGKAPIGPTGSGVGEKGIFKPKIKLTPTQTTLMVVGSIMVGGIIGGVVVSANKSKRKRR